MEEKKQKMMEKELLKIAKLEKSKLEKSNSKTKSNVEKVSSSSLLNLNSQENVVLGENIVVKVFCNAILKTGKNIGCQCSNKALENGRCKRHVNTSSSECVENKVIEFYF